ncbi:juvenile hormone epoxide hydrolase 1-like isoform X2 [Bacillus rossius redtenbacheri]|uniref:juvenile hormone epoxide hydrolase 1-like isoform X2 n=1 Tax=Bacillus rossius redtenbacheri TaxID=93214 RepID=UPI002FDCCD77
MGLLAKLVVLLAAILVGYLYKTLNTVPSMPKLESKWWGRGQPQRVDQSIRPFKINIPQKTLDDLKARLKRAPELTPPLEGVGFEYGFNSEYLQEVVRHWHDKYTWREREALLNSLPQFKTYVDGLDLHFIHAKPKSVPTGTRVLPLLLLHGWPGSVREFYGLIPLLTTPRTGVDFVFEVVAPSLPGYGFSEGASKPGLGPAQVAVVMKGLMNKLGFDKFYAQGGDWGSAIVSYLGALYKDEVLGIHLNFCMSNRPISNLKWILGSLWPTLVADEKYVDRMYPVGAKFSNLVKESGYLHIQATKPDTVSVALRDSPVGLAAYILEKFSTWTNPAWQSRRDGGLTVKYQLDDLLDNIMIYWVTGSITTSMRLYSEHFNQQNLAIHEYRRLVQVSHLARGGHFAAFEEPRLLADDVWAAAGRFLRLQPSPRVARVRVHSALGVFFSAARKQTPLGMIPAVFSIRVALFFFFWVF